ncbi:MAG: hypothetical protein U0325_20530 [Polyangiales bacterium]
MIAQAPLAQAGTPLGRAGHARSQPPQCATLLRVSASQPFAALPSQSAKPVAQTLTPQTPAAQRAVPLAGVHARPHPPQWARLSRVSTSQPLVGSPSQSALPAAQA